MGKLSIQYTNEHNTRNSIENDKKKFLRSIQIMNFQLEIQHLIYQLILVSLIRVVIDKVIP